MGKKLRVLLIVALAIILLIPWPRYVGDGGTVYYCAILYKLTVYHSLDDRYESGYYEAVDFKVFPFNFMEN